MIISSTIKNSYQQNDVLVTTSSNQKEINIPSKTEGQGSSVNGGELLFLALATCFCNDMYREAARREISIHSVEVIVSGEFGREGEPATNINYKVKIQSDHNSPQVISELIQHADQVAEIHNTLRKGVSVSLIR